MAKTDVGTFQIQSWDENAYQEAEGEAKLSKAEIAQHYSGALEGEACLQCFMVSGSCGSR